MIYALECCLEIFKKKKNKLLVHTTTWTNFKIILLEKDVRWERVIGDWCHLYKIIGNPFLIHYKCIMMESRSVVAWKWRVLVQKVGTEKLQNIMTNFFWGEISIFIILYHNDVFTNEHLFQNIKFYTLNICSFLDIIYT